VDTDALAPGKYLKFPIETIAAHCLETLRPDFPAGIQPGDIIVGGVGFGIGSSREQAAGVLKHMGVAGIVATGAARIFYRNAINFGLPVLVCEDTSRLVDGTMARIDLKRATVMGGADEVLATCEPMPDFLQEIIADGGLVGNLRRRLAARTPQ
jgi:3-isopropylmalate/(R)-2-methylmalate dehydratase small subunit